MSYYSETMNVSKGEQIAPSVTFWMHPQENKNHEALPIPMLGTTVLKKKGKHLFQSNVCSFAKGTLM